MSAAGTGMWPQLVTTALLGTDRRAETTAPTADVASTVLDQAVQHRAALLAGSPLTRCASPPKAPDERLEPAPAEAQELLAALLRAPEPGLVNAWLAICAARGLGASSDSWPRLASVAARSTAYDRRLLVGVLGPRGRWLLRQNSQWARLTSVEPQAAGTLSDRQGQPEVALGALARGEPAGHIMQLLLDCPDPWPERLTMAGLRLVASGDLGAETRAAGIALALRVPLAQAAEVISWAGQEAAQSTLVAAASAATLRTVQLALSVLQRTLSARVEIDQAFGEQQRGGAGP